MDYQALHIVLVFLDASAANAIVILTPNDPKQQVAINHGLAAAVQLAAGALVSRGIRALGGRVAR